MLNHLVLVALMPAIMAKPIAQRSQSVVPAGMGGVMYHNNIPTAAAEAMDLNSSSMKNAAVEEISDMGADIPRNVKQNGNKAASQTQNLARAPEPTVFVAPTQVVGRQINTTMLNDISSHAVSFATGITESIAAGLSNLSPSKRGEEPAAATHTTNTVNTVNTANGTATETKNCDCIGLCSDVDGKAKQMQCIKECAQSCDGDDDSKKKDPVKNLLGSLGLREITPAQIEHAKRPKPKPVHVTAVASEEAFEECMEKCSTHNCQHSSVGLSIDQCGQTSCEESCAKHRKGKAGMKITKKGLEFADDYPAAKPAPKPAHKAPTHKSAAAKEEEEWETCMEGCKSHNCQHTGVGLDTEQCGKTSCEEGCAKFKKAKQFAADNMIHTKYLRAVDAYPTKKPEPKPKQDMTLKFKEDEEFEACVKKCRTHNCQHTGVGLDTEQCGDTSCADSCAMYKKDKAGMIHGKVHHAREQLDYPTTPMPPPKHTPKPQAHPEHKDVKSSEHEEFKACMKDCKTHNCQHSSPGLSIDPCSDTWCADACVKYKKNAKAGKKIIHKKQVQPVPQIEPLPAVPAVAPIPAVPAVAPLPAVPAIPAVAPLPAVAAVPNAAPAPNVAVVPNRPSAAAPAGPAGPGSHPPPDGLVAAKAGSVDFESCMKQCKTHNCQHTGVGLDTEQCGDTSCEDACASYREADSAVVGKKKVKSPGAKLVANPFAGPHTLAVPNIHEVPVAEGYENQEFEECVHKCRTRNCQKTGVGLDTEQCGDTSCEEKCVKYKGDAAFRAHGKV
ncbi:hypothetical protein F4781DRAFT_195751 [Annulohypoxylon bovei var. microspora]|nr:hypothetical protein F4781DRAFT_195751 [Annulohypoxylon bovei var. microspora]